MKSPLKTKLISGLWSHAELIMWLAGIAMVMISDPCQEHFSLCLVRMSGLGYCPGCGLGHSIGFLVRGDIISSLHAHILGIPAFIFIVLRIFKLSKPLFLHTLKQPSTWTHYS